MDKIEKAIINDNIRDLLVGLNGYALPSRTDEFYALQAYELIIPFFDKYNREHPEIGLKDKYLRALLELLNSENAYELLSGCTCTIKQAEFEKNPDFKLKFENTSELLKLAKSKMVEKRTALTEMMTNLSSSTIAPMYYDNLSNQLDEKIGGLAM